MRLNTGRCVLLLLLLLDSSVEQMALAYSGTLSADPLSDFDSGVAARAGVVRGPGQLDDGPRLLLREGRRRSGANVGGSRGLLPRQGRLPRRAPLRRRPDCARGSRRCERSKTLWASKATLLKACSDRDILGVPKPGVGPRSEGLGLEVGPPRFHKNFRYG